jgi:hypothetical protein
MQLQQVTLKRIENMLSDVDWTTHPIITSIQYKTTKLPLMPYIKNSSKFDFSVLDKQLWFKLGAFSRFVEDPKDLPSQFDVAKGMPMIYISQARDIVTLELIDEDEFIDRGANEQKNAKLTLNNMEENIWHNVEFDNSSPVLDNPDNDINLPLSGDWSA